MLEDEVQYHLHKMTEHMVRLLDAGFPPGQLLAEANDVIDPYCDD